LAEPNRRRIIGLAVVSLFLTTGIWALDKETVIDRRDDGRYSLIGVKLGGWSNQSDDVAIDPLVAADMPETGFFTEVFYDHRFTPAILAEFSLGAISRGEARISRYDDEYIGPLNLYPFLVMIKVSPLSGRNRSLHPFLVAGGGFVFGRQSVEIIRSADPFYDRYFVEKTQTDFTWSAGGGIDFAVAEQFGITVGAKYMPVAFSNGLAGIKDYSGFSIALGFSYHLYKKEKKP